MQEIGRSFPVSVVSVPDSVVSVSVLYRDPTVAKIQLKRCRGESFANFRQICFDFAYYFVLVLYLSNCLIRRVCKNRFCHFRTFPWLLKKICKIKTNLSEIRKALPSPPLQLNFSHCICVAIFIILESRLYRYVTRTNVPFFDH